MNTGVLSHQLRKHVHYGDFIAMRPIQRLEELFLNIGPKSPHGRRVEPDILVSIHGSNPGSFLHLQKFENISDGVHKCVVVTNGTATRSHLMLPGNGQIFKHNSLMGNLSLVFQAKQRSPI